MGVIEQGIAITPPMGWRSWNAFSLDISEGRILQQLSALRQPGPGQSASLLILGYDEVAVDDGWQACGAGVGGSFHDVDGHPLVNKTRFPDIKAMVTAARAQGVKMGWYHNNCWCNESGAFPRGHPAQDVKQVVDAGFAGLKIDGCGPAHNLSEWARYIQSAGTPIVVENCADNGATVEWKPALPQDVASNDCGGFHFYRISRGVGPLDGPSFFSAMWNLQTMLPFLDKKNPLSRPGCWAYPDMLQVGNMVSFEESRTHFGAWCVTSSPLILGFDLANASLRDAVYPIVGNRMAIRVNQEYAGHPGALAAQSGASFAARARWGPARLNHSMDVELPEWQVWAKPQAEGAVAVLFINLADRAQTVSVQAVNLGISDAKAYHVIDIWAQAIAHANWKESHWSFENVAPHASVFLRFEVSQSSLGPRTWTYVVVCTALLALAVGACVWQNIATPHARIESSESSGEEGDDSTHSGALLS